MTNDEKRAIIEAATPGPWEVYKDKIEIEHDYLSGYTGPLTTINGPSGYDYESGPISGHLDVYGVANAKFIAAARTEWPKDLERLEELERENKRLREEARRAADLLEAVCGDCSDFINNIRMCISNEYCDVLSTCDNIKVLLRGKG